MTKREHITATGKPGGLIRKHSEDERARILGELHALLDRVEEWHASTAVPVRPQPGSLLEAANALSQPFPASFIINQLLTNATDHLHALRTLIVTAQAQHIYAPYTLIRSALEHAMMVLYMLRDATPQSAAFEALRYEYGNMVENEKAALTIGVCEAEVKESRRAREALLDEAIARSQVRSDQVKSSPTSVGRIMARTTAAYRLGRLPHSMWQLCSAATHGKSWAIPMLAMMDAVDDGESATITGRLMSDEASIRNALLTASRVLERAFTVREIHSKPKGHTGQSFFRSQPQ